MKLVNRQKFIATAIILGITATPFVSSPWLSGSTAFAADAVSSSINEVRTLGLMTGGTNGDFMPEKVLTRAEMAKILCNIFELNVNKDPQTVYMDVSAANWSAPYVEAVQAAGYMSGAGELFRPNQAVTRQELITSLVKAMDLHSEANSEASLSAMEVARSYGLAIAESNTDLNAPLDRKTGADLFVQLLDHPVGQVDAQGSTVRVGNIPYKVNGDLQGLFGVENGTVLKGAKLNIDRSQRTVTHVNTIELNSNGGVFDGKGISFDGNLIVNGSVTLNNIQSTGNLQINNTNNTLLLAQLNNSSWGNVIISALDSKLQASGNSVIGKLTLNNTATVQTTDSATIKNLNIQPGLKELTLDGRVEELDGSEYNGNPLVILQPSAVVGNMKLSPSKTATDLIRNYPSQKSVVTNINGKQNTDSNTSTTTNTNTNNKKKDKDKNKAPIEIGLDVSQLLGTINKSYELMSHYTELPGSVQHPEDQPMIWHDMLQTATSNAKLVLNQSNATQQDIDAAVIELNKATKHYLSAQAALFSYIDLLTTVKNTAPDYTDGGRFDFKEKIMSFALYYYDPTTTQEQFDQYTNDIKDMKAQFMAIQHIDFTELNRKFRWMGETAASTSNVQNAQTLLQLREQYMNIMHGITSQDQVDSLLRQLNEVLDMRGLNPSQHETTDYSAKLIELSQEVYTLLYRDNNQLDRYMEFDFWNMQEELTRANQALTSEDASVNYQESYQSLKMTWDIFKFGYDVKLTSMRNELSQQVVELDGILVKYSPYLPEYDGQRLKTLRSDAEQMLSTNTASLSKVGRLQTDIMNTIKNANLKDPARLLVLIDQAKAEYNKYSKYHNDFYSQDGYKDNMKFNSAIRYAEAIIVSENARQQNIIEQEGILQMALADYSTDWITESMIQNKLNNAQYIIMYYGNPSNPYSVSLQKAIKALQDAQSVSPGLTFPELRDLYIDLVEKQVALEQHPNAVEMEPTPGSSTPEAGGISDTPAPTPNDPTPDSTNEESPTSNQEEIPGSDSSTDPQAPATEQPSTGTTPVSDNEPTSQPVNNEPTVIAPSDQNYDYNRPPQPSEEAPAATPVMVEDPSTTEAP